MKDRGSRPTSKVLAFKRTLPDEGRCGSAALESGGGSFFIAGAYGWRNSASLCIEATHLPTRMCPYLLEDFEPSESLYRALAERYGLQIHMADEVAEASVATAGEAKLLRVRGKSPVFRFTRTAYLHDGQPIEFVKSTYQGGTAARS